jgi:hypothetical protein
MTDPVFDFGSNLAGRHGKGAALWARTQRGAIYGQAEGLQGNSYAIPTKDGRLNTLPLSAIRWHVVAFLRFARNSPEMQFELTPIGCGLAGYTPADIAPMFADAPANVIMPAEFLAALPPRLFEVGETVRKTTGYPFPGEIRCRFTTKAGKVRYVVEATGADYEGMLHIFEGDRLAPVETEPK